MLLSMSMSSQLHQRVRPVRSFQRALVQVSKPCLVVMGNSLTGPLASFETSLWTPPTPRPPKNLHDGCTRREMFKVCLSHELFHSFLASEEARPFLGEWEEKNAVLVAPSLNQAPVGLVHVRNTFSLSEEPRKDDLALAHSWLQRNPQFSVCVLLILNRVSKKTRRETRLVPYLVSRDIATLGEISLFEDQTTAAPKPLLLKQQEPPSDARAPSVSSSVDIVGEIDVHPGSRPAFTYDSSELEAMQRARRDQNRIVSQYKGVSRGPVAPEMIVDEKEGVPEDERKTIRYGYLKLLEKYGWTIRLVVFDSRQHSLIYASLDRNGALTVPKHIHFVNIIRVQLCKMSNRQFEIDLTDIPGEPYKSSTVRFLCDSEEDAKSWVELLHRAAPRLKETEQPPAPPPKPSHIQVLKSSGSIASPSAGSKPTRTLETDLKPGQARNSSLNGPPPPPTNPCSNSQMLPTQSAKVPPPPPPPRPRPPPRPTRAATPPPPPPKPLGNRNVAERVPPMPHGTSLAGAPPPNPLAMKQTVDQPLPSRMPESIPNRVASTGKVAAMISQFNNNSSSPKQSNTHKDHSVLERASSGRRQMRPHTTEEVMRQIHLQQHQASHSSTPRIPPPPPPRWTSQS